MAYDATKFQLTHLLQGAWSRMGQLKRWVATGGSTTTVVNTDWAIPEEPIYEDDDPSLILGTVVITKDAGGAGAAPEGEFGMATDYDSASSTITMDAVSTAVASGDKFGIVSPLFPLEDMINLANLALQKIGEIDLVDTSVSTSNGTFVYTLPSTIRTKPMRIRRQLTAYPSTEWEVLSNWDLVPATAGSNWSIIIPETYSEYTLEIMYRARHPELKVYSDSIQETIHPELAICALVAEAYQWYNNQIGGSNQYFMQRENKAIADLEAAKVLYPPFRFAGQVQGFPHWDCD